MLNIWQYFNQKNLHKYQEICNKINKEYSTLVNEQPLKQGITLEQMILGLKNSNTNHLEKITKSIAIAKLAAIESVGMSYFDVQIIGALALIDGAIAEMKTGEGKTLMCTAAAVANYTLGHKVHIATANEYLAQRDYKLNKPLFDLLGIKSRFNISALTKEEKKEAYSCDIIYSTAQEMGFDYLKDNLALSLEKKVQQFNFGEVVAIIDEADFILIDEARTPLIITGDSNLLNKEFYTTIKIIADNLIEMGQSGEYEKFKLNQEDVPGDFWVDYKAKNIHFSEQGYKTIESAIENLCHETPQLEYVLGISNHNLSVSREKQEAVIGSKLLYQPSNFWIIHEITNALKARCLFLKDRQYIIKDGKIVIVDSHTGRLGTNRIWVDGLHQAIETKEGVEVNAESRITGIISIQNYFRLYSKISGMTGTAMANAQEFEDVYGSNVIQIPTHKPMIRNDLPDSIFLTARAKYEHLVADVINQHSKGRPILVGTASVEESEHISTLLSKHNIEHNMLNAKNNAFESQMIAQAGMLNGVTVSTSMAGRGTDIILGGNRDKIEEISQQQANRLNQLIIDLNAGRYDTDFQNEEDKEKTKKILLEHITVLNKIDKETFFNVTISRNIEQFLEIIESKRIFLSAEDMFCIQIKATMQNILDFLKNLHNRLGDGFETQKNRVCELGGLYVIGSSRNESRRIDDQLKGRSGRQGDPGESKFYLSFEDQWLKVFAKQSLFQFLKVNAQENVNLSSPLITKAVFRAQESIEGLHYNHRRVTFQYDNVLDESRKAFFKLRDSFLREKTLSKTVLETAILEYSNLLRNKDYIRQKHIEQNTLKKTRAYILNKENETDNVPYDSSYEISSIQYCVDDIKNKTTTFDQKHSSIVIVLRFAFNIETDLAKKIANFICLNEIKQKIEPETDLNVVSQEHLGRIIPGYEGEMGDFFENYLMQYIKTYVDYEQTTVCMIKALDDFWLDYLNATDYVRKGIRLVAYINKAPTIEYRKSCYDLFESLIHNFKNNALNYLI